jgi:uncharacterized protein with ParB-like and HNH nuclease domain
MPDVIQHIKEEMNDSYSDDSLFNISSWGADLSFRELIQRYEDDELVKPELQRHYVWDRTEASRFIDSLLLGLPVPSIFLAQTADEKLLIIDGFQRIMTVYDFVRGIFSRDGKVFRLSRSERINSRWRGKAFSELGETEQRRIKNTTIHAIIFVQQQPADDDTSLFQVFERINTSGRTLLSQEIRNCVAQGKLNDLLLELNQVQVWRSLFGSVETDPRMRDMEFILRFFALSSDDFKNDSRESISLKRFLDVFMKKHANPSDEAIQELRNRFTTSINLINSSFGSGAFHNLSPSDPNKLVQKFSPTLFDSIVIATDFSIRRGLMEMVQNAQDAKKVMLQDVDYRFAISKETMTRSCINTRINKACNFLFGLDYE